MMTTSCQHQVNQPRTFYSGDPSKQEEVEPLQEVMEEEDRGDDRGTAAAESFEKKGKFWGRRVR